MHPLKSNCLSVFLTLERCVSNSNFFRFLLCINLTKKIGFAVMECFNLSIRSPMQRLALLLTLLLISSTADCSKRYGVSFKDNSYTLLVGIDKEISPVYFGKKRDWLWIIIIMSMPIEMEKKRPTKLSDATPLNTRVLACTQAQQHICVTQRH